MLCLGKKARNKSSCVDRPCAQYVKKYRSDKNGQMCYISQGVRAVFAQNCVCTSRQAAIRMIMKTIPHLNTVSQNPSPLKRRAAKMRLVILTLSN